MIRFSRICNAPNRAKESCGVEVVDIGFIPIPDHKIGKGLVEKTGWGVTGLTAGMLDDGCSTATDMVCPLAKAYVYHPCELK